MHNNMRKVLQIRATGDLLGAERVVLELSTLLPNFGYDATIAVPLEADQDKPLLGVEAEKAGLNIVYFPISGPFDLRVIKKIRQFVSDNCFDIVHSHGYREDLYALGCKGTVPLVATNHLWKGTDWKLKTYERLDSILLRYFDAIIAVSKPVRDDMLNRHLQDSMISVVPNGISTEEFDRNKGKGSLRREFSIPDDRIIVGTLSSLSAEKGLNFAIEGVAKALKTNKNIHLVIVGNGPQAMELASLTKQLNIETNVTFTGRRGDIPNILDSLNIFLLPSLIEGLPMALLEAMASNNAIIATDVGDVREAINDHTGILIPPKEPEIIAEKLITLVNNSEYRKNLAEAALKFVKSQFSSSAMTEHYARIYTNLVSAK